MVVAPLLSMRSISKSFGSVLVLRKVDFDLREGEVHVLAGENGAGKSTLIKILGGVYPDYEGVVLLNGEPVQPHTPQEANAYGIAVIHQESTLIPSLSVLDNVFLGHERVKVRIWLDRRAQRRAAQGVLDQLGLAVDLGSPVEKHPLAVRQLLEVAKALLQDVRVLVMDEPTSALNEVESRRLFEVVARLKAQGRGIVFITHRLEEIYRLADRVTILRDGRLAVSARAEELPPGPLVRHMIGREVNQQFPPRRALAQARPILRLQRFCVPDPHRTAHWAVRDASLEVGAGEVVGLAGLHGSGASELLQGLFGRWGPVTEGAALLEGVPFSVRSPRRSIRNGVALLTSDRQNTGLIRQMNLTENLTIAALKDFSPRLWLRRSAEREAALGHIHRLAIRPPWPEAGVASLSGGNQQKVLLARWLQVRPRLLLLDEPTRGVDVGAKHDIYQWMNEWTAEGAAILWISSELEELLAMSDRVLVMHRGRITAEYARDRIDRDQVLKAAMGEGRPC